MKKTTFKKTVSAVLLYLFILTCIAAAEEIDHFNRARELYEQGIVLEAIRELNLHIKEFPRDYEARRLLAFACFQTKQYLASMKECKEAIELRPGDREIADIYKKAKTKRWQRLGKEVVKYEEALRLHPEDYRTCLALGKVYAELGDEKKAITYYEQIISENPDDLFLLLEYARFLVWMKRFDEAVKSYQGYLALEENAAARLEMINAMAWGRHYAPAIKELRELLENNPEDLEAHLIMGRIYRWSGDYEEASEKYRFILRRNPSHAAAKEGLRISNELKDKAVHMPTVEELETRLKEEPGDYTSRLALARLLFINGHFKKAKEVYESCLKEKPEDIQARLEYGRALFSLGYYPEAIIEYKAYLEKKGEDNIVRFEMAGSLYWAKMYSEAEIELKRIIAAEPEHIKAHWTLAVMYQDLKRWDEALERYRAVFSINSGYKVAARKVKEIETNPCYLIGKYECWLAAHPEDSATRFLLGDVFFKEGRFYEARTELKSVIDIGHPDLRARELYEQAGAMIKEKQEEDIRKYRALFIADRDDYATELELARLLTASGNYDEAIVHYKRYLSKYPGNYVVKREYAQMLSWVPDYYGDSLREYRRLILFDPENIGLRSDLARIMLRKRGWWGEAEREYKKLLSLDPINVEFHLDLADLYRYQRRYRDSLRMYRLVLNLDPGSRRARQGLDTIEDLFSPRINPFLRLISDNLNYTEEQYGVRARIFSKDGRLGFVPSCVGYSFKEDEIGEVEADEHSLSFEALLGEYTRGILWGGWTDYREGNTTFSFGGRGQCRWDPRNLVTMEYSNYDIVHEVETVRSLLSETVSETTVGVTSVVERKFKAIEGDKATVSWLHLPIEDEKVNFYEKLTFSGNASYAVYSDENRARSFLVYLFYRVINNPYIDFGPGYRYLAYINRSDDYFSPLSGEYDGPLTAVRIGGYWREKVSYALEVEGFYIREAKKVERSLLGKLYYNFSKNFTAGFVTTYSESPRTEMEIVTTGTTTSEVKKSGLYKYTTLVLECIYTF